MKSRGPEIREIPTALPPLQPLQLRLSTLLCLALLPDAHSHTHASGHAETMSHMAATAATRRAARTSVQQSAADPSSRAAPQGTLGHKMLRLLSFLMLVSPVSCFSPAISRQVLATGPWSHAKYFHVLRAPLDDDDDDFADENIYDVLDEQAMSDDEDEELVSDDELVDEADSLDFLGALEDEDEEVGEEDDISEFGMTDFDVDFDYDDYDEDDDFAAKRNRKKPASRRSTYEDYEEDFEDLDDSDLADKLVWR